MAMIQVFTLMEFFLYWGILIQRLKSYFLIKTIVIIQPYITKISTGIPRFTLLMWRHKIKTVEAKTAEIEVT